MATPANWRQGDDVIITGTVSNEEADKIFPGYKTVKPYLPLRRSRSGRYGFWATMKTALKTMSADCELPVSCPFVNGERHVQDALILWIARMVYR